ncbi:MAG: hypothetical protein ACF8R7_17910 [Phycisphaerales bacterium JB039]
MRLVDRLRLLNIALPLTGMAIAGAALTGVIVAAASGSILAIVAILLGAAVVSALDLLIRAALEGPVIRQLKSAGPGPCPGCGYPADGRAGDRCPECGDPTPPREIRDVWKRRLGWWWRGVPF